MSANPQLPYREQNHPHTTTRVSKRKTKQALSPMLFGQSA